MPSTEEIYGSIISSRYHSYYKYLFEIIITTDKGYELLVKAGGDPDSVYRLCPESIDWDDIIEEPEVILEPIIDV